MKTNAIFDLASITKPIATATAMAILMERYSISPSTPFTEILTEYQGKLIEKISLMNLARHVSGFNNFKPYIQCNKVTQNVLKMEPIHKVGQYEYACINYILLGMIVEEISGMNLSEFCQKYIFAPLNMNETGFFPIKNFDSKRLVKSIYTPQLGIVSDEPARMAGQPIGNAGMYSTAKDLAKYCVMILQDGFYRGKYILSHKAFKLLTTNPKPLSTSPYTFGWRVNDPERNPSEFSRNTIMHTGWTGQSMWIDLENKEYIIILTNRTGGHSESALARLKLSELVLLYFHNDGL